MNAVEKQLYELLAEIQTLITSIEQRTGSIPSLTKLSLYELQAINKALDSKEGGVSDQSCEEPKVSVELKKNADWPSTLRTLSISARGLETHVVISLKNTILEQVALDMHKQGFTFDDYVAVVKAVDLERKTLQ